MLTVGNDEAAVERQLADGQLELPGVRRGRCVAGGHGAGSGRYGLAANARRRLRPAPGGMQRLRGGRRCYFPAWVLARARGRGRGDRRGAGAGLRPVLDARRSPRAAGKGGGDGAGLAAPVRRAGGGRLRSAFNRAGRASWILIRLLPGPVRVGGPPARSPRSWPLRVAAARRWGELASVFVAVGAGLGGPPRACCWVLGAAVQVINTSCLW